MVWEPWEVLYIASAIMTALGTEGINTKEIHMMDVSADLYSRYHAQLEGAIGTDS